MYDKPLSIRLFPKTISKNIDKDIYTFKCIL